MAKRARDYLKLVEDQFLMTHRKTARDEIIRTTVGDLIAALAEEVEPYAKDKKEVGILVSYMLMDLSRVRPRRLQPAKRPYLSLAAHAH